jgi:hypothetical protein
MMAEQLRGPFEKFVDSPYSKKRPSPHLHKVPARSNKVRDVTQTLMTFRGMKITLLLRYPNHYNLA